jgi:hypothetical protein
MKKLLFVALPALLAACAGTPWKAALPPQPLAADTGRLKQGGHCESSALLNALAAAGYDFSEADIIGFGSAPSFVYQRGKFPFIGGRSETMREAFFSTTGIAWGHRLPASGEEAWKGVFDLLERGLPAMLRVDMRFLPYRYAGKYGPAYMSFGWHWISLFGVDPATGLAQVMDTDLPGLQTIALRDLDKARSSPLKLWPPKSEYAWVEPRAKEWKPERQAWARKAVKESARLMAGGPLPGGLTGLAALETLPSELAGLDAYVPSYLLGPALGYMAASIERNGTGGAAFRTLYAVWLEGAAREAEEPVFAARLSAAAVEARKAEAEWQALARAFDAGSTEAKVAKTQAARGGLEARLGEAAKGLVLAEARLVKGLELCAKD